MTIRTYEITVDVPDRGDWDEHVRRQVLGIRSNFVIKTVVPIPTTGKRWYERIEQDHEERTGTFL